MSAGRRISRRSRRAWRNSWRRVSGKPACAGRGRALRCGQHRCAACGCADFDHAGRSCARLPSGLGVSFAPSAAAADITVWQTLHHTSGLGDFFVPEFFRNREKFVDPASYIDPIALQPKSFAPGKERSYSELGPRKPDPHSAIRRTISI
ncbi:MAG: serine hydrolase [Sphingopyxis sp.]|nr:serine hydrolase [Sphingopyxis sp.]